MTGYVSILHFVLVFVHTLTGPAYSFIISIFTVLNIVTSLVFSEARRAIGTTYFAVSKKVS